MTFPKSRGFILTPRAWRRASGAGCFHRIVLVLTSCEADGEGHQCQHRPATGSTRHFPAESRGGERQPTAAHRSPPQPSAPMMRLIARPGMAAGALGRNWGAVASNGGRWGGRGRVERCGVGCAASKRSSAPDIWGTALPESRSPRPPKLGGPPDGGVGHRA